MNRWSRRDLLKSSVALPASTLIGSSPLVTLAEAIAPTETVTASSARERLLLDFDWRFHFGHASDPTKDFNFSNGRSREFQKTGNFLPIAALAYDDSEWRILDLPHDWVIELPFKNDPALSSKGFYPVGRNYPENSVGWYRKVFEIPETDKGKRITVEFDGIYREALVVLNGYYIGQHRGGYDPFSFDLTDFIAAGQPNVLLVRVDASLSDGWFYEGAGIYRHVWLTKTAPIHVKKWGTFVRSLIENGTAKIQIRTEVENQTEKSQSFRVVSTILDRGGKIVAKASSSAASFSDGSERAVEQEIKVARPAVWSLEERNLYLLVSEVEVEGKIVDRYDTRFGIRSLHFDAEQGFFLNGKPVKIKGTCNHQDHAGLGVALPDAAQYFRVRKLQEMGCNAYRSSHNPPTPELLDACDELGMLVLDETRMMSSNPEGLLQFEDLIRRDRNHPSVFMWSMGNEEFEATTEVGLNVLSSMKKVATQTDGSRPVTVAPPPLGIGLGHGGLTVSDVMGYNYADPQIEAYHKQHPSIPAMGTENVSAVATRGIYRLDPEKGFVSSYDPYTTTGRASGEGWWRFVNARPWMAGGFIWTGFDYRGEPSPYQWPNISSQYGVIDTCGFPKDTFYYFQAWWTEKPVLHVFPHWNWPGLEGKTIAVWVHSNLDRVELFHNGQSLGAKDVPKDSHLQWIVNYEPGTIEARGFKAGQQVMVTKRETTGSAAKLTIHADRETISADGEDVAFFTVEVQDAEGRVLPVTESEVSFQVTGPGLLKGVGNGDPTSHESDIGSKRKAFSGLCMAVVQASKVAGEIKIEASSPGLTSATAIVRASAVTLRPQLSGWIRPVPSGAGISGLWRPLVAGQQGGPEVLQMDVPGDSLYTFMQEGDTLTGKLEAPAGGFGGSAAGPIEEGKVDGHNLSFRIGTSTYTGIIQEDRIELHRTGSAFPGFPSPPPPSSSGPQPAIGPPPDGIDPSMGAMRFRGGAQRPIILRRTAR